MGGGGVSKLWIVNILACLKSVTECTTVCEFTMCVSRVRVLTDNISYTANWGWEWEGWVGGCVQYIGEYRRRMGGTEVEGEGGREGRMGEWVNEWVGRDPGSGEWTKAGDRGTQQLSMLKSHSNLPSPPAPPPPPPPQQHHLSRDLVVLSAALQRVMSYRDFEFTSYIRLTEGNE